MIGTNIGLRAYPRVDGCHFENPPQPRRKIGRGKHTGTSAADRIADQLIQPLVGHLFVRESKAANVLFVVQQSKEQMLAAYISMPELSGKLYGAVERLVGFLCE